MFRWAVVALGLSAYPSVASGQQQAQGFGVERFYPSAPGGGWFVMDDLGMRGELGGVMAVMAGYSSKPLRVTDGSRRVAVVSERAFTDFGFAVTGSFWRVYLNFDMPLATSGDDGVVGGYSFATRSIDLGLRPDTLSDLRLGVDARLFGGARSRFRLGAGAQLFVPNGQRADSGTDGVSKAMYETDGTYRAMARVLFAGDAGLFAYAGQVGFHLRPLDDSPVPGSPRGSEMLFGVAAGPRLRVGRNGGAVAVVGPEVSGATAIGSFLATAATGVEALVSGRVEGAAVEGPQLRVKLGVGGGLNPHFGAPEWRVVFGLEVFDHGAHREKDGPPRP